MNEETKRIVIVSAIIGLLAVVGGILLLWWGAYTSCTTGGGYLKYNVLTNPFVCVSSNATIPFCDNGLGGYGLQLFINSTSTDARVVNISGWTK